MGRRLRQPKVRSEDESSKPRKRRQVPRVIESNPQTSSDEFFCRRFAALITFREPEPWAAKTLAHGYPLPSLSAAVAIRCRRDRDFPFLSPFTVISDILRQTGNCPEKWKFN